MWVPIYCDSVSVAPSTRRNIVEPIVGLLMNPKARQHLEAACRPCFGELAWWACKDSNLGVQGGDKTSHWSAGVVLSVAA